MKILNRIFLIGLGVITIALFVSFFKPSSASAQTAEIILDATNSGDAGANVNYYVVGVNDIVAGQGSFYVGPNLSASQVILHSPISNPYYVIWEPIKIQGSDPRDVNCTDPITTLSYAGSGFGGGALFIADLNFACWIPQAPPVSVTPANNLRVNLTCESSTSVRTSFSWTPATASGTTIDAQWLDFAFVNPPDPGGFGFQNRNVGVGASSYAESGFVPNTAHYWKINSHATNGQWYPSTVASFTTPNCLPELIATLNSVPDLNVGQNHTFSGTINNQGPVSAGTSQARFCVALSGVNQDCYNSSATMVGSAHNVGNLASQGQQSLTSATWQPQNAGQYVAWLCADIAKVVSEQIETNNCANRTFNVSTVSVPPLACSPSSQTVNIGQAANLSASGGSGTYSWTASGGSPSSGSGANFSVSYSTSGGKTVRVTSGGVSANCSVSVQSIPQISLTVTTNCPNGIDAIVHLSWTSGTSDSQFNIVRDGVWITSTNIKSWDSGPEAQGQSHTWNVLGVQTGTLSNSVTKTTATCVPPPPTDRTSPCPPKGDLNGDNIVDQKDLDLIGTFYGQTSQYHLDRADLDGNGAINTQDIFLLGQFVGGSINTFPACPTVPPPSPSPSPSPPSGGIRLTVTSDCLDGVNAHVHLRWTVSTGDTQFGLVADGITFTSTFDTFWDSSVPEVQGRVRSWTVWGVQTGTVSNTVTHRTITCGSQPSPTPPPGEIRLTVTSDCLDGVNAQVHLRWTATTGDIQFNIVKNGIHLVSTFGTSWDSGGGHGGRNSWNVMGLQTGTLSNTVTHTTATCAPQPQLPDLTVQSISFDKDPFPTYQANEIVTVNVVIENIGPVDVTKVNVRFFSDLTSRPDCSTPSASAQTTLAEVDGNRGTASWGPFTFSAPATVGAKQAWALVGCGTTQSRVDNDTRSKTYNVSEVGAWFETTGGDVGSRKQIKVGQTPPAGRFQSSYILVGNPADSSAKTARWKLSTYSRNLVPAGKVYDYFASRFLSKAQQNPCNITSNSSGLRYCSGTQTIGGLNLTGTNAVWFIIGDLVVNADVTVDPGSTAVFLVSGNIFINTNVNRADGVYIAGGTFNDSDSANASGRQLVINGAVYAQNVSLARVLGGPTCSSGPECDNAQTPALLVNFAPKYLMQMTSLLGSPSFLWREIEP